MRITHLSSRLDYYGGEVCLANLAEGLAARGHEVSCLVRPDSALATRLGSSPVRVVPTPMVDWFDPGTVRRVRQWLRQQQIEVLATHLPRDYFIAATAARGLSLCNVATRHQLKPLSLPLLKRPFLKKFGAVIAVSEAVAWSLRRGRLVSDDRVVTVPNGIAAPAARGSGPGLRARAGVSPTALVIAMVGKLSPEKGADLLLRAAGQLTQTWPDLQVFLVGDAGKDGGYESHLRSLADDLGLAARVHFFGFVPDAAAYSREFDVQVVASHAEPFGLVTVEAMACGVPVVATNTGGSPEILRDGVEGFLVPPGDAGVLVNRLSCLLGSAGLRWEMGERGRSRFQDRFTLERMVSATEKVYERALMARKTGRAAISG